MRQPKEKLFVFFGYESKTKSLKQNLRVALEGGKMKTLKAPVKDAISLDLKTSRWHRPITDAEYEEIFESKND